MRLILINGKPGTGKTTVSKCLLPMLLEPSAWIDTDDLMHVRPFDGTAVCTDALERAMLLSTDFEKRGYLNLIISGCAHSKELASLVKHSDVLFVQLTAHSTASHDRKITQGYHPEKNPTMFNAIKSDEKPLTAADVVPFQFAAIDTSNEAPEQIAAQIAALAA